MNKKLVFAAVSAIYVLGFSGAAASATLAEAVQQTLQTNPDILTDASRRLSTDEAIKEAKGGYLPRVDLNLGAGRQWSDNISTQASDRDAKTLWRTESGLTLSQMLYDGFATRSEVQRQEARQKSAVHKVNGTSEQITLKAIETYLDALRKAELLELAKINLGAHEKTYEQIKIRSDSGVGRKADLEQAQARLALSRANVAAAEANLRESNITYKRLVGADPSDLSKPETPSGLPGDVDTALKVAMDNHPIIRSAMADVEAAQAQNHAAESAMQPRVDLELGTNWNRNVDGIHFKDHDAYAMVRMRYNLFHGGTDKARVAETSQQVQEAITILNHTQRQVEESLRLSWNALLTAQERLPQLKEHADATEKTRDAYAKQFSIGQRTLLDLLDSENELYTARSDYVDAQYIELFAHYRLMADMGRLLDSLGVTPRDEGRLPSMAAYAKDVADSAKADSSSPTKAEPEPEPAATKPESADAPPAP